jgi:hypothetical protein
MAPKNEPSMQAKSYSPEFSDENRIAGDSSVPYRKEGTMPTPL